MSGGSEEERKGGYLTQNYQFPFLVNFIIKFKFII